MESWRETIKMLRKGEQGMPAFYLSFRWEIHWVSLKIQWPLRFFLRMKHILVLPEY